ncbi:MAG: zinc ribbon domain-containing protein [Acidimicrobiales bacterium]
MPSSQTCSGCGNIKGDLTLADWTYVCEACGLVINHDLNATINLACWTPKRVQSATALGEHVGPTA